VPGCPRRSPVLIGLLLAGLLAAAPARAGVVAGSALDGPSPDLQGVGGAAMAADGGGAVAYLRADAGVPHVFVVVLTRGAWSPPVRVDGALTAAAAQPVVAAAAGGRVAVAFLSGGTLYAAVRPAGFGFGFGFGPPQAIAGSAADPTLSMGRSGTAYLAYAVAPGDVRAARLDRTAAAFTGLPDTLDSASSPGAGTGPLWRARVVVSADATGLVVWGAPGADGRTHVLARRVYGLHVSTVLADVSVDELDGRPGGSADTPDVGIADDSSYAWIAWRQTFAGADGTQVARALVRPLVGSELGPPQAVDALGAPPGDAAGAPSLAIDGLGDRLTAALQVGSGTVVGAATGPGGAFGPAQGLGQAAGAGWASPVAALSRDGRGIVAFPTTQGGLEARLLDRGAVVGEAPLARPDYGPVDPGGGLAAAADASGDAIVAYLQGDAGARRLAVAAVVDPPGTFAGLTTDHSVGVSRPLLAWTAARGAFSPILYTVLLDGRPIGTTSATRLQVPAPLADGTHRWQVVARDGLGQQTASPVRALRIAVPHRRARPGHLVVRVPAIR
jgi:hypothetical protein